MLSPKQVSSQAASLLTLVEVVRTAEKYKKQILELKETADGIEHSRKEAVSEQKLAQESVEKAEIAWGRTHTEREVLTQAKLDFKETADTFNQYSIDTETEFRADRVNLQNMRDVISKDMEAMALKEANFSTIQDSLTRQKKSIAKREDAINEKEKKLSEVFK